MQAQTHTGTHLHTRTRSRAHAERQNQHRPPLSRGLPLRPSARAKSKIDARALPRGRRLAEDCASVGDERQTPPGQALLAAQPCSHYLVRRARQGSDAQLQKKPRDTARARSSRAMRFVGPLARVREQLAVMTCAWLFASALPSFPALACVPRKRQSQRRGLLELARAQRVAAEPLSRRTQLPCAAPPDSQYATHAPQCASAVSETCCCILQWPTSVGNSSAKQ